MATSKLLKPTNVTINIPEGTDIPDQSVSSNCIDKEADAINALSDQIGLKVITAVLTFDGVKFPAQYPPKNNYQLCIPARNVATGSIYILYYQTSIQGFVVAAIVGSGSAPTEGQTVQVQYGI